jgi:hypothetical protein
MTLDRLLFLPLVLSSALSAGCSMCSGDGGGPTPAASLPVQETVAPGDRVVAEYASASFVEGTVTAVGREALTLVEQDGGQSRQVDPANAYRLGGPTKTDWKAGDLAICHAGSGRWRGCRVEVSSPSELSVTDDKGEKATLAPGELLVPTALTKLNLERAFARVERARAFAKGAQEVGTLYRPPEWKPRAGEGVIVRNGSSYVAATVSEARATLLLVQSSGGEKARAVAPEDVWPEPPVDASLTPGGYACLRPKPGEQTWRIVRVDAVRDAKADVSLATGEQTTAEQKNLLPFVARRVP